MYYSLCVVLKIKCTNSELRQCSSDVCFLNINLLQVFQKNLIFFYSTKRAAQYSELVRVLALQSQDSSAAMF